MPLLTRALEPDEVALARQPRDDVVVEVPAGPDRFTASAGPFSRYERSLAAGDDGTTVETIDYRLAPMVWPFPFAALYRKALATRRADGGKPWWSPPESPDAHASTALGSLCVLALVFGYIGTLLTQTITYAAEEFSASKTDQAATLAAVRIGVLGALAITALADRHGRRRALLSCALAGVCLAALSGLAPDLLALGTGQTFVRGLATAGGVLVTIVAVEEMPAGSRAFAITLISAAGALGAGICLAALPLADVGDRGWRVVMVGSLLLLPLVRLTARHLPESRRYDAAHADVGMAGHGQRFWLLAASAFLLSLFTAPASQLLNEFLRDEENFSAVRITLFSILTNTPGGIGLVVGGRLADTRGRRLVGATGIIAGVLLTVAMVLIGGWPMWGLSVAAAITGAMVVPALGVYGPELFPTALRGRANGIIAILGVTGSVIGLGVAGYLSDRWDGLGPALALLSIGPLLMAVLVLVAYPETAHRELEELNPEDELGSAGATPAASPAVAAPPVHWPPC
jgi:MFS family permease